MRTFDFYASIGLDRAKPPGQLAAEIDWALTAPGLDAGQVDQLRTARAILGDPARRTIYDRHLDDPAAGPLGVEELRRLAGTGSAAGPAGPGPAPAAGAHPGPPTGGGAGARLRHGLAAGAAGARRGWARVAGAARTRPRAALGAAAAVLVLALVLAAGVIGLGGAGSDGASPGGETATGVEGDWREANFTAQSIGEPAERYLDAELAGSALFHRFTRREDVDPAMLPTGRFTDLAEKQRQLELAAVPGRTTYAVTIRPVDERNRLRATRVAFAEDEDGPVIVRTGFIVQRSVGINEGSVTFLAERYDATDGEPIDSREIPWDLEDGILPVPLTYHRGVLAIAGFEESVGSAGYSDRDLAAGVLVDLGTGETRPIPEFSPGHYGTDGDSFSLSGGLEDNLRFIDGAPFLTLRVWQGGMVHLSAHDLTTGQAHQILAHDAYLDSFSIHERPHGLVIHDSAAGELRTWSPAGGLSEVLLRTTPEEYAQVTAMGDRAVVTDDDNGIRVVDLATGEQIFAIAPDQLSRITVDYLGVDEDHVYIRDGDMRFKIDPATGEQLDEQVLSLPEGNHDGYRFRISPPVSAGWSGDNATFAFR
ncbi:hypothetical protein CSPHI_10540 [Corynebacterium sphenisci DSM 44792]|uniref:Uncharacterized protein n=1 Tax=Corynebacterium sphenisci DSM 44792 TaxID=1437874 RepID=A0A1L7D040_9CORY|nr:hypothetical protein [Corynebacterium sphenisci]APT91361.1 hypothetical protein CSPHI_10540 [Corynebacterium sphenisci DSM 44792]